MNQPDPLLMLPPELSDQTARQLLDVLHALISILENHYAAQIHRCTYPDLPAEEPSSDPSWDEDHPPF
jgi:hypothetical protein